VKWRDGLRNRVSITLRRYTEYMKFYCFFHIILVLFCIVVYGCTFCMGLFDFVYYVSLLLCMFCSVYSVSLCCFVFCLCVNVYCTAATGGQHNCS
jgi:hypothetical protein